MSRQRFRLPQRVPILSRLLSRSKQRQGHQLIAEDSFAEEDKAFAAPFQDEAQTVGLSFSSQDSSSRLARKRSEKREQGMKRMRVEDASPQLDVAATPEASQLFSQNLWEAEPIVVNEDQEPFESVVFQDADFIATDELNNLETVVTPVSVTQISFPQVQLPKSTPVEAEVDWVTHDNPDLRPLAEIRIPVDQDEIDDVYSPPTVEGARNEFDGQGEVRNVIFDQLTKTVRHDWRRTLPLVGLDATNPSKDASLVDIEETTLDTKTESSGSITLNKDLPLDNRRTFLPTNILDATGPGSPWMTSTWRDTMWKNDVSTEQDDQQEDQNLLVDHNPVALRKVSTRISHRTTPLCSSQQIEFGQTDEEDCDSLIEFLDGPERAQASGAPVRRTRLVVATENRKVASYETSDRMYDLTEEVDHTSVGGASSSKLTLRSRSTKSHSPKTKASSSQSGRHAPTKVRSFSSDGCSGESSYDSTSVSHMSETECNQTTGLSCGAIPKGVPSQKDLSKLIKSISLNRENSEYLLEKKDEALHEIKMFTRKGSDLLQKVLKRQ